MSIRTSFRGLTSSLRSLSTTTRLANTPSTSTEPAKDSGFDALTAILDNAPSTSSLFQDPSPASTSTASAPIIVNPDTVRGYTAHSLPPDIDPLLELFTNLLMKHGRKAEAEGRVSRILSLL